jgi:hypothetical protein
MHGEDPIAWTCYEEGRKAGRDIADCGFLIPDFGQQSRLRLVSCIPAFLMESALGIWG